MNQKTINEQYQVQKNLNQIKYNRASKRPARARTISLIGGWQINHNSKNIKFLHS